MTLPRGLLSACAVALAAVLLVPSAASARMVSVGIPTFVKLSATGAPQGNLRFTHALRAGAEANGVSIIISEWGTRQVRSLAQPDGCEDVAVARRCSVTMPLADVPATGQRKMKRNTLYVVQAGATQLDGGPATFALPVFKLFWTV